MKKILPCFLVLFLLTSCDSKKESIIDSQKLINNQLAGLADSLKRVSDSADYNRIKTEIHYQQYRFDSLNNELKKFH